ncbi:hypothetical protein Ct61P_11082 [Colletotrichum tofieldiae]|nr:hypothetical protein Ct61P_11082 [Colletotrichum tofieldiae]
MLSSIKLDNQNLRILSLTIVVDTTDLCQHCDSHFILVLAKGCPRACGHLLHIENRVDAGMELEVQSQSVLRFALDFGNRCEKAFLARSAGSARCQVLNGCDLRGCADADSNLS